MHGAAIPTCHALSVALPPDAFLSTATTTPSPHPSPPHATRADWPAPQRISSSRPDLDEERPLLLSVPSSDLFPTCTHLVCSGAEEGGEGEGEREVGKWREVGEVGGGVSPALYLAPFQPPAVGSDAAAHPGMLGMLRPSAPQQHGAAASTENAEGVDELLGGGHAGPHGAEAVLASPDQPEIQLEFDSDRLDASALGAAPPAALPVAPPPATPPAVWASAEAEELHGESRNGIPSSAASASQPPLIPLPFRTRFESGGPEAVAQPAGALEAVVVTAWGAGEEAERQLPHAAPSAALLAAEAGTARPARPATGVLSPGGARWEAVGEAPAGTARPACPATGVLSPGGARWEAGGEAPAGTAKLAAVEALPSAPAGVAAVEALPSGPAEVAAAEALARGSAELAAWEVAAAAREEEVGRGFPPGVCQSSSGEAGGGMHSGEAELAAEPWQHQVC
jgi:hypothetical protein